MIAVLQRVLKAGTGESPPEVCVMSARDSWISRGKPWKRSGRIVRSRLLTAIEAALNICCRVAAREL
ncbi:MAG: hypothetical protein GX443_00305 [Deltaproteobacteria bacterium]|nr:hypothetical protein [Deltaproteobacteria bacterium]